MPAIADTTFVPRAWSTYLGAIMSLVQEGPLAFGDDLSLIPAVADPGSRPIDTTYKYTMRDGVTFGDGSPLTPDDVVASFQFHMKPKSGSQLAAFFSSVDSVEATGANEVTVKLKAPNVQFQYTPAHMAGFIFKKSQLEEFPEDIGTPDALPLGTGPYKLVEFSPADRVVLEARDDYWGPKPVVKRIVFSSIPDRQTRLLAMQNGDIDGTFDLAISDIDQWKSLGNVDVITAPSLGVFMLTMDQSAPPFDDIHVRKAVAYAIDRDGLVQALLKGNGEPATALNPPEMWAGVLPLDEARAFYATLPGYQLRPREGQGRAGAVGASRRVRGHRSRLDRRPLHGQHPAERDGEPEADRHQRDGAGGRRTTTGSRATSGTRISACRSWPTIPTSPIRRTIRTCSSPAPMR